MVIKVAIPTDDGETISRHFGQAKTFQVLTVENGQVTGSETRQKASHQHGDHSHAEGVHPGQQMVETIADCQVLICGGMGDPAYQRALTAGLTVILTRQVQIDAALKA
jgi:predicted Fe-Mo cluster-binding NifX family protein